MITNFLEWKSKHKKEGDDKMRGKIHSFDSFGTVDGPRNKIYDIYARMWLKM